MSINLIQSSTKVRRFSNRKTMGGYQQLVREWRILGLHVWTSVVATESVPVWAEAQLAALGSTDWKSEFSQWIDGE